MSLQPCVNNFENCPYLFQDAHHLYKLAEADTSLKRIYANLGCNVIQLCRCVHEELEATLGWLDYPSDGVMIDTINQEFTAGNLALSATKKRRLGLNPPATK